MLILITILADAEPFHSWGHVIRLVDGMTENCPRRSYTGGTDENKNHRHSHPPVKARVHTVRQELAPFAIGAGADSRVSFVALQKTPTANNPPVAARYMLHRTRRVHSLNIRDL